ncbi:ribosomal RNA large subunit methyltransferase I [Paenibacillus larvae subsp. larvae]|uniref:Ribosomal RNA large subunit methyltransferase I n=1 Tax=Paenibacillus larvae subsp. larvae TaxID=147375 RepID=A0A2L1TZ05_9BACL|nr:class I SAM-dependent methyltransferase [Paenibacillus larvae]AQZ47993.1 SAM-dependent methyltransferase [Paenibacillus larvae subsp. pulvifaciens]AVF25905.1 ribosomal RNA large subunit methyltransferase I [Paenibacillus larvae subsp. larvae]AVF30682.1 ribosomal RNA large subunit methyltransferase I [Paenibacillus larvae subsp. larvae]MBH0342388.1 SAM-dependent methyltransferase [Paenibacillus larvae]MCY7522425.1 class I SAM-dependent methyltransferase [Paenibacillus larvae]
MFVADKWSDYELIDTGGGEKLERWGSYILRRPDPQIIWPLEQDRGMWRKADGHYHRSSSGGGSWDFRKDLPERWTISYDNKLRFHIKPTGFKHTGLFPEQAANWDWMIHKIQQAERPVKVLNLFAYTGGASVACAYAGASVVHVDASKGVVQWAKENLQLSGLGDRHVRFITDDVFKFVQREQRRGNQYDAIIMDPPSYGRGPNGETWKLENDLYPFIESCTAILSNTPLFLLVNSYTTGISSTVIENVLTLVMKKRYGGRLTSGEIGLPITKSGLVLPCGILGRWEA